MVHRLVLGMIWMLFTVDFFYSCKTKRVGGSNATQWTQIYWTVQHWWFICSLIFFTWILQVLRSKGMLPSSIPAFHKLLLFSKSKNVQSIEDKLYPALNIYVDDVITGVQCLCSNLNTHLQILFWQPVKVTRRSLPESLIELKSQRN